MLYFDNIFNINIIIKQDIIYNCLNIEISIFLKENHLL
jgi:hypothetical protein